MNIIGKVIMDSIFLMGLIGWVFIVFSLKSYKTEKDFFNLKRITKLSAMANICFLIVILCNF